MTTLDLSKDPIAITEDLVNISSVSFDEAAIADACEGALRFLQVYDVVRRGNTVVARTSLGHRERVMIAGHIDTVPLNDNLPARREQTEQGEILWGLGTCDMKSGDACILKLAHQLAQPGQSPNRDVTFILYEAEEVDAVSNGLFKLSQSDPDLLAADFAILMEPSNAVIEAGCQGTLRAVVRTRGERAHSARSWRGVNAIHAAGDILARLAAYHPRKPIIDGLEYHEGLNAVGIRGGVAGNVIPDLCEVEVNYRFAPDRSAQEAQDFIRDFFGGFEVEFVDIMAGALPGLHLPAAAAFVARAGGVVNPKFGWTDVARFSALGVPAVNFGPGDPMFAHKQDEHVFTEQITHCYQTLRVWLAG